MKKIKKSLKLKKSLLLSKSCRNSRLRIFKRSRRTETPLFGRKITTKLVLNSQFMRDSAILTKRLMPKVGKIYLTSRQNFKNNQILFCFRGRFPQECISSSRKSYLKCYQTIVLPLIFYPMKMLFNTKNSFIRRRSVRSISNRSNLLMQIMTKTTVNSQW